MCCFQWFCVAVVLCSAMFSCDARIICIIPMDGFYLLLSYFSFIKNLYSTMCVHSIQVYSYWKLGGRSEMNVKKGEINVHFKRNCETDVRAPRFSIFLLLFYYPVSHAFCFVFYIYITLPSSQCQQQHWFGQMTALPEMTEAKKCYKHI